MRSMRQIFGNASPEEKVLMLDRFRTDFPYFCERVLNSKLPKFHIKETVPLVINNRFSVIIIPRQHLKTSLFGINYPIWRLWREDATMYREGFQAGLVGNAVDQSIKTFNVVRENIQDNALLKQLIPENRSSAWTKQIVTTSTGNKYFVKPFNSSTRGSSFDLLICDDLLREENMGQEEIKEMFWSVLYPTINTRQGQIIVIGTPQTPHDLLAELEEKKNWASVRKRAVIMDNSKKWIKPLWDEKFTLQNLRDTEEQMGAFRFNREFLCQPVGIGSQVYPPEIVLECARDDLSYSLNTKGKVYVGCDFAMSGSKYGDYSVFTVVDTYYDKEKEFGVENPIVIKRVERYKGLNFEAQVNRIVDLYVQYNASCCIIDVSGVGQAFMDDLIANHLSVIDRKFDARSRNNYLVTLRKLLEQKRVVIPYNQNDMDAYRNSKVLVDELSNMNEKETPNGTRTILSEGDHDDTVMSLALAVSECGTQRPVQALMAF